MRRSRTRPTLPRPAKNGKVVGATLKFPPAYSPDLNSIEQVFAKLKALATSDGSAQRRYAVAGPRDHHRLRVVQGMQKLHPPHPRLRTQLAPPDKKRSQGNGCIEISGELVVAGSDPPPVLEV
jgi:hypothetical protein